MIKNPLLKAIRINAALVFDSFSRLVPKKNGNAVLVVRLDAVGDYFLWMRTGAVDLSRHARATGGRVVLFANPLWAEFARTTGLWDEVIEVASKRFILDPLYRLKLLFRIRRMGIAQFVQTRASRVFLLEDAMARVCGAQRRIGPSGTLFNQTAALRARGNRYYDLLIPADEGLEVHESRRNSQITQGITGTAPTPYRFVPVSEAERQDSIVVVMGAGHSGRIWPIEMLAKLVAHTKKKYPDLTVVIAGLPLDEEDSRKLCALAGVPTENRVGRTSLPELVDCIARCRLVICNESSAYQIAVAYDRDVVCALGGGHFGHFVPLPVSMRTGGKTADVFVRMDCFGCNWNCIYPITSTGACKCVADIPLDSMVAAVDSMLVDLAGGQRRLQSCE